jgi:hypothetical protein
MRTTPACLPDGLSEQSLIGPGQEDDHDHKLGSDLMQARPTETIPVTSSPCFQSAMGVRRFSGKGPTSTLPLGLRVKPASRAKIAYLRRAVVALPVAARIEAFAFGQRLPFDLSDCRLGRLSRRQGWPVLRSHGLFTNRRFGAAWRPQRYRPTAPIPQRRLRRNQPR